MIPPSLWPQPIGVLGATFAVMMLGWLWFDRLFGRSYALLLGREYPPQAKPAPLFFIGPAVCMLVTTIASSVLIRWLGIRTLGAAVGYGLLVGIGLLATTAVNMGINPNIPRPLAYGALSASYFVISSVLIAIILVLLG